MVALRAEAMQRSSALRDLLQTADAICAYEEELIEPTMVLNVPASPIAVRTVLGLLGAGLATDAQGFLALRSQGWLYDFEQGGLFVPPAAAQ